MGVKKRPKIAQNDSACCLALVEQIIACWRRPSQRTLKDLRPATFVVSSSGKDIAEVYEFGTLLGEGGFGSVVVATHRKSQRQHALKKISKARTQDKFNAATFEGEVAVMTGLDHPNIVKIHETYQDAQCYYLVMELCTGGDLFDAIVQGQKEGRLSFTEKQAATLMRQIFGAIAHMHEKGIAHLDLKPENLLLLEKGKTIDETPLKVADFGLASVFGPGMWLTRNVGTPFYVAPEVLRSKYDHRADVWSCGVIMYVLLFGRPPFSGSSTRQTLRKVHLGKFRFPEEVNVSNQAKSLVRELLQKQASARPTAQHVLRHAWMREAKAEYSSASLSTVVSQISHFQAEHNLKKVALHIIANQLHESDIQELRKTFQQLDVNGDGELTMEELEHGLHDHRIEGANLEDVLKSADLDGSGRLSYSEFIAAALQERMYHKKEVLWQAFNFFDRNSDGKISKEELHQVVRSKEVEGSGIPDVISMMETADRNGDEEIDFNEFLEIMGFAEEEKTRVRESIAEIAEDEEQLELLCSATTVSAPAFQEPRGVFGVRDSVREYFRTHEHVGFRRFVKRTTQKVFRRGSL